MARQTGDNVAQARRPRRLTVKQRHEQAFRGQLANPQIGSVRCYQTVKFIPRQTLHKSMKYAILTTHGVDPPSRVRIIGETSRTESNQCHAPCPAKTQPDSREPASEMTRSHAVAPAFDVTEITVAEKPAPVCVRSRYNSGKHDVADVLDRYRQGAASPRVGERHQQNDDRNKQLLAKRSVVGGAPRQSPELG
jgi:hypothetical protein